MMNKSVSLLFTIILLVLLFIYFSFFVTINFIKLMNFFLKIDSILKESNFETKNEYRIKFDELDSNHAIELGYKNYLYEINGTEWGDGINILIIGSDRRFLSEKKARADVIIVIRINSKGEILSISIPRDTLITLTEENFRGYKDKIGHSYYWEGLDGIKKSVETLLNSSMNRIIIIDSFQIIEVLMHIIGEIDIKGFNSKNSLAWLRNRNFKEGDIERCKRQQIFLKKCIEKLWIITKNGNYIYISLLFNAIKKVIYTDITSDDLIKILIVLKSNKFDPQKNFYTAVLPGYFGKYNSALLLKNNLDCWFPDPIILNRIQFLFYSSNRISFLPENIKQYELLKNEMLQLFTYYNNSKN